MYQSRNSNFKEITWLMIFLAALHVTPPVQSLPPYRLTSAVIEAENPADGADVFTTAIYEKIELEYVDYGISHFLGTMADGTTNKVLFRSLDYRTMISNYVAFDTGNPDRLVDCYFVNEKDADEFYKILIPIHNLCHPVKYPIISAALYTYEYNMSDNREDGQSHDTVHNVSAEGHLYAEPISEPDANGRVMKRFIIISNDRGKANMVFTSKSFNVIWERRKDIPYVMLSIETSIKSALFKILVKFKNPSAARGFYTYVSANDDFNPNIPCNVPEIWQRDLGYFPKKKKK